MPPSVWCHSALSKIVSVTFADSEHTEELREDPCTNSSSEPVTDAPPAEEAAVNGSLFGTRKPLKVVQNDSQLFDSPPANVQGVKKPQPQTL